MPPSDDSESESTDDTALVTLKKSQGNNAKTAVPKKATSMPTVIDKAEPEVHPAALPIVEGTE
jgi:hypothetical protein